MPKQAKTETVGFRCTADFKKQVLEIASSQNMEPSEYLHSVVENDVKRRLWNPLKRRRLSSSRHFTNTLTKFYLSYLRTWTRDWL